MFDPIHVSIKKKNKITYQCNLSVCRKADIPSISTRTTTVAPAQNANKGTSKNTPTGNAKFSPICITMDHNTSDSSKKNKNKEIEFNIVLISHIFLYTEKL